MDQHIIKNIQFTATVVDTEQRLVEGFLGDSGVDFDGHMIDQVGYMKAIEEYATWGNVREMHKNPIGVLVSHGEKSWNHIVVKIVDDAAWNKVVEGVYKGFSIGGRVLSSTWKSVSQVPPEKFFGLPDIIKNAIMDIGRILSIESILISEISIVDRPANPRALILAYKGLDIDDLLPVSTEILAAQEQYFKGELTMDEKQKDQVTDNAQVDTETAVEDAVTEPEIEKTVDTEEAQTEQSVSDNTVSSDATSVDILKFVDETTQRVAGLEQKITIIDSLQKSIDDLNSQFEALSKAITAAVSEPEVEAEDVETEQVESETEKEVSVEITKELNIEDIVSKAAEAAVQKYIKATEANGERQNVVNSGESVTKSVDGDEDTEPTEPANVDFSKLPKQQRYAVLARTVAETIGR